MSKDAVRVVCLVEGRTVDGTDVCVFLGIVAPKNSTDDSAETNAGMFFGPVPGTSNPTPWHVFLIVRYAMREGRLLYVLSTGMSTSDIERGGALFALCHVGDAADNDFQRAFITLGETIAVCRLGDSARASAPLSQLCAHRQQYRMLGDNYPVVMEHIATA